MTVDPHVDVYALAKQHFEAILAAVGGSELQAVDVAHLISACALLTALSAEDEAAGVRIFTEGIVRNIAKLRAAILGREMATDVGAA